MILILSLLTTFSFAWECPKETLLPKEVHEMLRSSIETRVDHINYDQCIKLNPDMQRDIRETISDALSCSNPHLGNFVDSPIGKRFEELVEKSTFNVSCPEKMNDADYQILAFAQAGLYAGDIRSHPGVSSVATIPYDYAKWPLIVFNRERFEPIAQNKYQTKALIFHEMLHSLGYQHGVDQEVSYTCQTCCFPEGPPNEALNVVACNLCYGNAPYEEYKAMYQTFKSLTREQLDKSGLQGYALPEFNVHPSRYGVKASLSDRFNKNLIPYFSSKLNGAYPISRDLINQIGDVNLQIDPKDHESAVALYAQYIYRCEEADPNGQVQSSEQENPIVDLLPPKCVLDYGLPKKNGNWSQFFNKEHCKNLSDFKSRISRGQTVNCKD